MIHSIGIWEQATEKTLMIDPTSIGVRVFMYNKALEERMHIELSLEDMIDVNRVLEKRIQDLETSSRKPTAEDVYAMLDSYNSMYSHEKSEGREVGLDAMWEIIRELTESNTLVVNNNIDYECQFCNNAASLADEFMHSPNCVVTKARALVAKKEKDNS